MDFLETGAKVAKSLSCTVCKRIRHAWKLSMCGFVTLYIIWSAGCFWEKGMHCALGMISYTKCITSGPFRPISSWHWKHVWWTVSRTQLKGQWIKGLEPLACFAVTDGDGLITSMSGLRLENVVVQFHTCEREPTNHCVRPSTESSDDPLCSVCLVVAKYWGGNWSL